MSFILRIQQSFMEAETWDVWTSIKILERDKGNNKKNQFNKEYLR